MGTQYEVYKLEYGGKTEGYRLVDDNNAFVDIPVSNAPESIKSIICCSGVLRLKMYDENGVKVLRTPQEKYGVDNGYIVPLGVKSGVQWYKWDRPQFRSVVKNVSSVFSNSRVLSRILGDRVIDFRSGDMSEELATYDFSFRLEQDFGEYSGMYKGEDFEALISRWLKGNKISYTDIGCSYADKGWFSCTIYFDGIDI